MNKFSDVDIKANMLDLIIFNTTHTLACCVCGEYGYKAAHSIYKGHTFLKDETFYIVPYWHIQCRELFKLTPYLYV